MDGIHVITGPELLGEASVSLEDLPDAVLTALLDIRTVRERHLRNLCAKDRRTVAAAERLMARNTDLQAQIDANAAESG